MLMFLQQRPNDYGIPVAVEVTYVQDNFLTSDVLNEMVWHPPVSPPLKPSVKGRISTVNLTIKIQEQGRF